MQEGRDRRGKRVGFGYDGGKGLRFEATMMNSVRCWQIYRK